jgi:hypothetical protein
MADNIRHVRPGQKMRGFPAEAFNSFRDASDWVKRHQFGQGARPVRHPMDLHLVYVRNDSGADRDWHDVLGISGVIITPTENANEFKTCVMVTGVVPTTAAPAGGKFVVRREPIPSGEIGRGHISGACPAKIEADADDYAWCDVNDGDPASLLASSTGSARIIYRESGTGVKDGYVLLAAGAGAEARGQYAWMIRMMVTQNQVGFGWLRAHARLPNP